MNNKSFQQNTSNLLQKEFVRIYIIIGTRTWGKEVQHEIPKVPCVAVGESQLVNNCIYKLAPAYTNYVSQRCRLNQSIFPYEY